MFTNFLLTFAQRVQSTRDSQWIHSTNHANDDEMPLEPITFDFQSNAQPIELQRKHLEQSNPPLSINRPPDGFDYTVLIYVRNESEFAR
jgi:hypothetical protein